MRDTRVRSAPPGSVLGPEDRAGWQGAAAAFFQGTRETLAEGRRRQRTLHERLPRLKALDWLRALD